MVNTWVNLQDTDLAYLAGLLDGEGSYGIFRDKTGPNTVVWRPKITISMTDEEVIDFVATTWGTTRHKVKRKQYNPNHNEQYVTIISGKKAIAFSEAIRPYVRLKVRQIDLFSRFGETYSTSNPERDEVRKSIYLLMRQYNNDRRYHPRTRTDY